MCLSHSRAHVQCTLWLKFWVLWSSVVWCWYLQFVFNSCFWQETQVTHKRWIANLNHFLLSSIKLLVASDYYRLHNFQYELYIWKFFALESSIFTGKHSTLEFQRILIQKGRYITAVIVMNNILSFGIFIMQLTYSSHSIACTSSIDVICNVVL